MRLTVLLRLPVKRFILNKTDLPGNYDRSYNQRYGKTKLQNNENSPDRKRASAFFLSYARQF